MNDAAQSNEMGQSPATPEGFIDKAEVARRLNKTIRTVDNWMARGILPYYKLGRTVAFRWSDVEAHMQANYRVCRRRGA
jgi:excisionase family DNA binding protein